MRLLLITWLIVSTARGVAHAEPPTVDRAARLIARGQAAEDAGDTISALSYYRDAVSAAPRRDVGYIALGALYLKLNEPARALEALRVGERWTVRGEALWLALYEAHKALHDDEAALAALRQLRAREPGSKRCLAALADEAEARGAFIEALAARRRLLALAEASEVGALRTQVRALEVLVGEAERVRAGLSCREGTRVERALARCP